MVSETGGKDERGSTRKSRMETNGLWPMLVEMTSYRPTSSIVATCIYHLRPRRPNSNKATQQKLANSKARK